MPLKQKIWSVILTFYVSTDNSKQSQCLRIMIKCKKFTSFYTSIHEHTSQNNYNREWGKFTPIYRWFGASLVFPVRQQWRCFNLGLSIDISQGFGAYTITDDLNIITLPVEFSAYFGPMKSQNIRCENVPLWNNIIIQWYPIFMQLIFSKILTTDTQ